MRLILAATAAIAISVTGCSSRVTDFTIISTKNFELSRMSEYQRSDIRVEGSDIKHIVIFVPTGIPNAKEAIDKAIESIPGAVALVDGVLSRKFFYIPLIYGQEGFVVRGTALIDPSLVSKKQNDASDEGLFIILDDSGKILQSKQVTLEELEQIAI